MAKLIILYLGPKIEVVFFSLFIPHMTLSTLLILAVCRTRVTYEPSKWPSSPRVSVAQWLERPTNIWEAMGSFPVRNSDFFFVPRSRLNQFDMSSLLIC